MVSVHFMLRHLVSLNSIHQVAGTEGTHLEENVP